MDVIVDRTFKVREDVMVDVKVFEHFGVVVDVVMTVLAGMLRQAHAALRLEGGSAATAFGTV